jgi:type II secretory pathway component PulK
MRDWTTRFGFPIKKTDDEVQNGNASKKGISLFVAMMAIALMMSVVADLMVSSFVNFELGLGARDRIKATYLAKSGQNLGIFLLSSSFALDLFMSGPMAGPAQAPPNDSDSSIWNSFNAMPPIGASAVKLISSMTQGDEDPFQLKGIFSETVAQQMAQFEDSFSIKITDEAARINLSLCTKETSCPIDQLIALFSCPAEKAFLDKKNISPETLAYRIYDFISASSQGTEASGFSDKDSPYQKYTPPYKTKRLPLDSLEDLKLIEGWDDEIHAVFAPYLTTFPFYENWSARNAPPLNINTAPPELLRCLVPGGGEGFLLQLSELKKQNQPLVKDQKGIDQFLKEKVFSKEADSNGKNQEKSKWFTNRSDVFRITVQAETGKQRQILTSVIRRIQPKDISFGRQNSQVKRSYQILYNRFQ